MRLIRNLLAADSWVFYTAPRSEVARSTAGQSALDSVSAVIFYEPGRHRDAGLAHDPFKALVAPRPIGWVSTMSDDGLVNLAP